MKSLLQGKLLSSLLTPACWSLCEGCDPGSSLLAPHHEYPSSHSAEWSFLVGSSNAPPHCSSRLENAPHTLLDCSGMAWYGAQPISENCPSHCSTWKDRLGLAPLLDLFLSAALIGLEQHSAESKQYIQISVALAPFSLCNSPFL